MFRKRHKHVYLAIVVGILIGLSTSVALASTYYGLWSYYGPILGHSYRNQSHINSELQAGSRVEVQPSGSTVPAGYMGVQARLYNSSGQLIQSSMWFYNSSNNALSLDFKMWKPDNLSRGTYYSKGQTSAYNGDGYYVLGTAQSPNVTY